MLKNSTLSDLEPFPTLCLLLLVSWFFLDMTDMSYSTTRSASSTSQTSC